MDDRKESNVEQPELFKFKPPNPRTRTEPNGYEVSALRECECPVPEPTEPQPLVRTLKIEADGDFWKGIIKPKIRIKGHWLERAGFRPGNRVQVACIAPGVIELRSANPLAANETTPCSSHSPVTRSSPAP